MAKLSKFESPDQPKYKPVEWTWLKIISVALLGSVAFYSTHQIDWKSIKTEQLIAQPNLNREIRSAINEFSHELTQTNSDNRQHFNENNDNNNNFVKSNSQMKALDFSLYEPIEAVENHEIHKRAVEHFSEEEDSRSMDKLKKFYFEDYVRIPLDKLERIKINKGKYSVSLIKQGTEDPPNEFLSLEDLTGSSNDNTDNGITAADYYSSSHHIDQFNGVGSAKKSGYPSGAHLSERNFLLARHITDSREGEHVLYNIPNVKKYHAPSRSYDDYPVHYNRDGSDQVKFLHRLAQSGADGAWKDFDELVDDYESRGRGNSAFDFSDDDFGDTGLSFGSIIGDEDEGLSADEILALRDLETGIETTTESAYSEVQKAITGPKYVSAELPCLKKENVIEGFMARSFMSFIEDDQQDKKSNGGGNGKPNHHEKEQDEVGKPVGCCNGKPYSAKKRCCCRRKSYDAETEFCCVSSNGCAAFQTFKNTTDNREACIQIGGNIVLNEYFDYQATPMIGWAANVPYGPAGNRLYSREQLSDKINNDLTERYYDLNPRRRPTSRNPSRPGLPARSEFELFKANELDRAINEQYNDNDLANVRYRTPNARAAYYNNRKMTSRDFIEDLRIGANPLGQDRSVGHH